MNKQVGIPSLVADGRSISVFFENGHKEMYYMRGDGSFISPTGCKNKLSRSDEKYCLTTDSDEVYRFENCGAFVGA